MGDTGPIVVVLASFSLLADAAPAPKVKATPAATPLATTARRMPAPREAPPRVFENIRGYLRQFDVKIPGFGRMGDDRASGSDTGSTAGSDKKGGGAGYVSGGSTGITGSGAGGRGPGSGGGGAKSSAGDGEEDGKVVIDESGASRDPRGPSGQKKGGSGKAPNDSGLTFNALWWPICFFIDASVDQGTANSAVKGVVDMAAACGVTVVAFPVTARGFVNDPETIKSQQQSACNLTEVGLAPLASTTAFVPFPDTAGAMCGKEKWEEKIQVAGCAEKARGGSPPAPSILVPKGHNGPVAAHEAMGHSQMNRPNLGEENAYTDAGNGIGHYGGTPFQVDGGEGNIKTGSGWSAVGCSIMRANALPNTKNFAYDSNRELYYVKQEDPERQHDMGSGKKLFGDPKGPPPPGSSQIAGGPKGGEGGGAGGGGAGDGSGLAGGQAVVSRPPATVNGGLGQGSTSIDDKGTTGAGPKPGGRHDVVGGGSAISLQELRKKNPPKEDARDDSFAVVTQKPSGGGAPPATFGGGGGRESVFIDESASLSTGVSVVSSAPSSSGSSGGSLYAEGSGASGVGSGGSLGGGGGSGEGKVGFDETMTANGPTAGAASKSPPKLFLGPRADAAAAAFQSTLSGDFFSKISLGEKAEVEASSRKPRTIDGAERRGGRRIASETEGGSVRSLRR